MTRCKLFFGLSPSLRWVVGPVVGKNEGDLTWRGSPCPEGCGGRYVGRGKWRSDPSLCVTCIAADDQTIIKEREKTSFVFSAASLFLEDEGNVVWKKGDCLAPTEGVLLGGDLPSSQGGGGLHVGI